MTPDQQWLSRRYILYRCLNSLWFSTAVWLYFYRLFVTDQQTGVIDGIGFAIGLLAEVPSGALADRFGRDTLVRIGLVLSGFGFLGQALFGGFSTFMILVPVTMIGVAFISGADEALFFDRLGFDRSSLDWRKLVTRGTQVGVIASLFAVVVGGLVFQIDPRLPFFLSGVAILVSAVAIWPVKEVRDKADTIHSSVAFQEYF